MADGGHGATITFQSGFFAELVAISHSGYERGVTETTHSTSTDGWRTFQPSDLKNLGEVEATLRLRPNDTPPIDQAPETGTVTFPIPSGSSTGAKLTATMFMTNFSYNVDCIGDDAMEASVTLKLSGSPTWTDAS